MAFSDNLWLFRCVSKGRCQSQTSNVDQNDFCVVSFGVIFFNSYFSALLFSKLKTYVFRTKEVIIVLVEMAELRRCDKTVWYPPNSHYFAPGPLERWLAILCPGPCVLTSEGPAVPPGRRGAWAATLRGTSFLHLPQPSAATFPSGSDVFIINRKSMRGRWYPPWPAHTRCLLSTETK